jgi:hypothetical protein
LAYTFEPPGPTALTTITPLKHWTESFDPV